MELLFFHVGMSEPHKDLIVVHATLCNIPMTLIKRLFMTLLSVTKYSKHPHRQTLPVQGAKNLPYGHLRCGIESSEMQ